MSTVWLPMQVRADVSDAERFGKLITGITKPIDPFNVSEVRKIVREEVLPASDRDDFLLFASPAIVMACFLSEWLSYYGEARCLFYRDSKKCYWEKRLSLDLRDSKGYNSA